MNIAWDTYHTEGISAKYLYRFTSLERAIEMLTNQTIYFPRMDEFEDKLEGISVYDITELEGFYNKVQPDMNWNPNLGKESIEETLKKAKRSLNDTHERIVNTQESHWVSCWYYSNRESMAMWSLYSKNKGVAIRIDRELLQNHIRDNRNNQAFHNKISLLIAGSVQYQDYRNVFLDERKHLIKYLAFRKDESFNHEQEYRFVLTSTKPISEKIKGINFNISVPFESLGLRIIANPRFDFNEFEKIKIELREINPKLILEHSELEKWFQFKEIVSSICSK